MAEQFSMPEFMEGNDPAEIQLRMMKNLPADIDTMPGGFPYDFTMPTAIVASELIQYYGMRLLMMMFPQYAWGKWLDMHAQQVGVYRKKAAPAKGEVTFYGSAGTTIEKGTLLCTPDFGDGVTFEFTTDSEAEIPEAGKVMIPASAVTGGSKSNVMAGTITLLLKPIHGVTAVSNEKEMSGGCDMETDEELYKRLKREYESGRYSYVGNDTDYIRWATEVTGVEDCIVVPTYDGAGTVKLIIIGTEGEVSETLINDVYDKIVSPNDRKARLLPTGCAKLYVTGPELKPLTYRITGVVYDDSVTSEEKIGADFRALLDQYYKTVRSTGKLSYNQIRGFITRIAGVSDYDNFTINEKQENLKFTEGVFPKTVNVFVTKEGN